MQQDVSRKRAKMPSPAMVVGIIALIVALTGTAFAGGFKLGKNSVGSRQLKAKAVNGRQDRQQRRQRDQGRERLDHRRRHRSQQARHRSKREHLGQCRQRQHRRRTRRGLPGRHGTDPGRLLRQTLEPGRHRRPDRGQRLRRERRLPARPARTVVDRRRSRSGLRLGDRSSVHRHLLREHLGLGVQHDLRLPGRPQRGRLRR